MSTQVERAIKLYFPAKMPTTTIPETASLFRLVRVPTKSPSPLCSVHYGTLTHNFENNNNDKSFAAFSTCVISHQISHPHHSSCSLRYTHTQIEKTTSLFRHVVFPAKSHHPLRAAFTTRHTLINNSKNRQVFFDLAISF